jgi:hemin uptake protein HemP
MSNRPTLRLASAPEPSDRERPEPTSSCPHHDARKLTGGAGEAEIVLDGTIYHLRITKAGKLILNK